nr:C29E4.6 protein - Caenorhabditis elegans [Caenorhabditis elegans]
MNEDRLDFRYLKSGNEGIMINKTIDPSQASMSNWKPVDDAFIKLQTLRYRPYRCFHCKKDGFYTEEEGRFHLSTRHPKDEVTLFKEYDPKKETAAREAFKQIFLICRDGPEVTKDRVHEWEREAEVEVMKFANLKFKRPIVLVRKLTSHSRQVQTPTYQNISLDSCQIPQTRPELQNIAINFRPMSVTTPHQDLSINRRGV